MTDIIFAIVLIIACILSFNKLAKLESEQFEKRLKNEIEKTKIIIDELKK